MAYCSRCGSDNPKDSLYCKECNAFIGDDEEKKRMDGNVYPSIKSYPLSFSYAYTESSSRAELFIRIVYAFILNIIAEIWGVVAEFALIFQFFYVLIYGKKHRGAFDFIGGYLRFYFNVTAYTLLITDERPPITDKDTGYPCKFSLTFEEKSERLELVIRIFYIVILSLIVSAWAVVTSVIVLIEWFYILITAKKSFGLWEFSVRFLNFLMRVTGYYFIMTDERPPLTGD